MNKKMTAGIAVWALAFIGSFVGVALFNKGADEYVNSL